MSKTRTRRPASDIRPARRSLVDLTAAASRAVDDGLLVASASLIAASRTIRRDRSLQRRRTTAQWLQGK